MEALILAIAALAQLVLIDAGYWIAISLGRWSPIIAIGVLAGWLAQHNGAESLETLGIGFLASVVARHAMLPHLNPALSLLTVWPSSWPWVCERAAAPHRHGA